MTDPRPSANSRGYSYKWQKASKGFLRDHPLCRMCERIGRVTPATLVDHIEPHRGDMKLFWDRDNWQSLCDTCHSRHKQRMEKSGVEAGCDLSGMPLDPNHHWHRPGQGG